MLLFYKNNDENNKVIWMSLDELQENENVDDEIKIKVKALYEMYK